MGVGEPSAAQLLELFFLTASFAEIFRVAPWLWRSMESRLGSR